MQGINLGFATSKAPSPWRIYDSCKLFFSFLNNRHLLVPLRHKINKHEQPDTRI